MNTILDTCSIVIIDNAGVFDKVLQLPNREWYVGQLVMDECNANGNSIANLDAAIAAGRVTLLDGTTLPADRYVALLNAHGLGEGETECLAYAESSDFHVITDDRRARFVISNSIGQERVCGFIGLLTQCTASGILPPRQSKEAYNLAIAKGAFLPDLPEDFFDPYS